MSDMVNLHFVSVIEALLECRSSSLSKLLPIWRPILHSESIQVINCFYHLFLTSYRTSFRLMIVVFTVTRSFIDAPAKLSEFPTTYLRYDC